MELKDVEIFRTGTHTDSSGKTRDWTSRDLAKLVDTYDPAQREAPAVVGHPQTDSPAYGWVERLRVVGDRLVADFKDLAQPFVQAIKDGLYRKRSISIYPDGSLRHVGFLGGMPPAVPGLKDIALATGAGEVTIDFEAPAEPGKQEGSDVDLQAALARIKELENQLADIKAKDTAGQHAAEKTALELKIKEAQEKAAKAEADFAAFKDGQVAAAREKRVEALATSGRIKPSEKGKVLAFAESHAKAGGTIDFAAEGGQAEKVSLEEAYFREYEARNENAHGLLGEFATAATAADYNAQDKPLNTKDINKHA